MTPSIVMRIVGEKLEMKFVVVSGLEKEDLLLGRSFFRKFDVLVDLNRNFMQIRNPNLRYKINHAEVLSNFKDNVAAKLTELTQHASLYDS